MLIESCLGIGKKVYKNQKSSTEKTQGDHFVLLSGSIEVFFDDTLNDGKEKPHQTQDTDDTDLK